MDLITTARNVLLVSLLAMLAYVLYKRMLHVMRKQHTQQKFPSLPNQLHWTADNHGQVTVTLHQEMEIEISIHHENGNFLFQIAQGIYPKGDHVFQFEKQALQVGRYYYKLSSPHEEASQYFQVA
jgi:hypothetical protein